MLTITRAGAGYSVKISEPGTGWRGYRVYAATVREIRETIDHYYGNEVRHWGKRRNCPLCRSMRDEMHRHAKGRRKHGPDNH